MPQPINFADFGRGFLSVAIDVNTLRQRLDAAMPRSVPFKQGSGFGSVSGTATIGTCFVRPRNEPRADPNSMLCFDVVLPMRMRLYVDLTAGQENYEITAYVTLLLWAQTCAPLAVNIDAYMPVPPEAVKLEVQSAGNWFDIARKADLDNQVRAAIAANITTEWRKTAAQRLVDIGALIRQSMTRSESLESDVPSKSSGKSTSKHFTNSYEDAEISQALRSDRSAGEVASKAKSSATKTKSTGDGHTVETAILVSKGETVEGTLAPSSVIYYRTSLEIDEKLTLTTYTKKQEKSVGFINAKIAVQDSEGGVLDQSEFIADSATDFSRERIEHTAEESGDHHFCVQNYSEDESLVFKVKIQ